MFTGLVRAAGPQVEESGSMNGAVAFSRLPLPLAAIAALLLASLGSTMAHAQGVGPATSASSSTTVESTAPRPFTFAGDVPDSEEPVAAPPCFPVHRSTSPRRDRPGL